MGSGSVCQALDALRAALDSLLDADFDGLREVELPAVLDAFERERRRLEAVDVAVIAAVERTHVASRLCRSSTADLLVHRLRVSAGEARARVRRAGDLAPRVSLLGEPLEPIHPVLATAQRAGELSTEQVQVITSAARGVPRQPGSPHTPT